MGGLLFICKASPEGKEKGTRGRIGEVQKERRGDTWRLVSGCIHWLFLSLSLHVYRPSHAPSSASDTLASFSF